MIRKTSAIPSFVYSLIHTHTHTHTHTHIPIIIMPKIRRARSRKPPAGFEDIEETLQEFQRKMRDSKYR
jgi:hypothetical protein